MSKKIKIVNIGDKYNHLTVISDPYYNKKNKYGFNFQQVKVKCDCGNIKEISATVCKKSKTCSRSCPYRNKENIIKSRENKAKKFKINKKFNYLTVIGDVFYEKRLRKNSIERRYMVPCKCVCGYIFNVRTEQLTKNTINSCGCINIEKTIKTNAAKMTPIINGKKLCIYCGETKSIEEFKKFVRYYASRCKHCTRLQGIFSAHGIPIEESNALFKKSNGCCQICNIKTKLYVDHNHITGKVRGLLCQQCNSALGFLKEDINIMQNAINYINNQ